MSPNRSVARGALLAAGAALLCAATPAFARKGDRKVEISPYIGVDQAVLANLKGYDDVLTFTNVYAGVDATISTQRVEARADLRYEHQFGWGRNAEDQDIISGLATAGVKVARDVTLEAGALGTRVRVDGLNGANNSFGSDGYSSQVYSAYVGPTLATRVGELDVSASYRLGYTRVEDDATVTVPGGALALSSAGDSIYHSAALSVGMRPGALPVGWTVSAGYDREDADQLDQRFEDKWARVDVTVPVTPTVALVGGVGYEEAQISQRDVLRDGDGNPVISGSGRYVTDSSSPRELVYDQDGLIWDVGVLWRPSRRTTLEARVGRRYGWTHYAGSFLWQMSDASSFGIVVYDRIDSFGRLVNANLVNLPGDFSVSRNPFTGDLSGCAFSVQGGGQCFNDALSGVATLNFRNRGVAAQYAAQRGRWNWGLGAGYSQRKFITPDNDLTLVSGSKDEILYGNALVGYGLDDRSGIDANVYVNRFDGGLRVLNVGAYTSYYRNVTRRLTATASVGVDSTDASDLDTIITALGQVGLRYQF